jgi:sensor domain CHASE-containing protein
MKRFSASNSVTRHVLGMLALISVLYLALAFVVLRFSVYASFAGLEADMVAEDARRVRQVLDGQFESLKGIAREWSAWDDTYEYVAGRNPEYADAYLFDGTLAASSLDVMAFLRPDGTPVWSRMIDLASGEPLTIAPLLSELGATQARFANRMQAGDAVSGVVSTPYGTVLIVALPVLRTDTSGPPAGTMVIGRLLTSTLVTSLAGRVGVPFRAYDAGTIPPALAAAWRALSATRAERHTETRDASGGG